MSKRYVKRPDVVEAVQWTGYNLNEMSAFWPAVIVVGPRRQLETPESSLERGWYVVRTTEPTGRVQYECLSEQSFVALYLPEEPQS